MELNKIKQTSLVTWIVFLATIIIVGITMVPVIFPALVLRALGGIENFTGTNPYEFGIWAWPFIIANVIVFSLAALYFTKKMPGIVQKPIRFIFNFEVSPGIAFIAVTLILGFYVFYNVTQIYNNAYDDDFYQRVQGWLQTYDISHVTSEEVGYHLMLAMEVVSMDLFASYKAILFITDVALLLVTYFFTVEITKKRFAGIISMFIVVQSGVFLIYQTYVSYPNFWVLFYLLSLYLVYKKWPLSPVLYLASVFTKIETVVFIPLTLFVIYRSTIPKKKKIYLVAIYVAIIIIGAGALYATHLSIEQTQSFNLHKFWDGFTAAYNSFRFDGLIMLFLLPLTVGLFAAARKGHIHAEWVLFLIMSLLIASPLIEAFSDTINVPYRFIPLVVFFAIGVGVLLSKKSLST